MNGNEHGSGHDSHEDGQNAATTPVRGQAVSIDGKMVYLSAQEHEQLRRVGESHSAFARYKREKWLETAGGRLCLEFFRKFQEYRAYMEKHPEARPWNGFVTPEFPEQDAFREVLRLVSECERERAEKDRRNLLRAQMAARCRHRHADGRRCGSPRVRGKELCHWHQRVEEAKALKLDLGSMEDPDSIQMAIMKLQRAVIDGGIEPKQTGQLAYLIQLAAWNVSRTSVALSAQAGRQEEQ